MSEGAAATQPETMQSTESSNLYKAIILGATGATGRYVVGEVLNSKSFSECTVLVRRKLTELPEPFKIDIGKEEESGHLKQEIINFDDANEENCLKYFEGKDVFLSCFGSTRHAAGGNENFRRIDYGNNVKFAEIAKKAGVGMLSLMSTTGAHSRSFVFYLKVKGQIEEAVTKLDFPLLSIFRPGFLDRLQPPRFVERVAGWFMSKISVAVVAKAMVNDALVQLKKGEDHKPHFHILSNHQIYDLVKEPTEKEGAVKEEEKSAKTDENSPSAQEPEKPAENVTAKDSESQPESQSESQPEVKSKFLLEPQPESESQSKPQPESPSAPEAESAAQDASA
eukprot:gene9745-10742_t